ncbi:MAG TPA: acylphosphatase [Xenococcaceae cyanobacterium]|jgi:acylphosphatase
MKKIKATISGRVQGVGFRISTLHQAQKLKIKGYVQNLSNGDVEIVAVGEATQIDTLLEWAKSGPESAVVNNIEIEVLPNKVAEFEDFTIHKSR